MVLNSEEERRINLCHYICSMSKPVICIGAALVDELFHACLLYTSDAADERSSVDLGGRRIIKKEKKERIFAQNTKYKKRI